MTTCTSANPISGQTLRLQRTFPQLEGETATLVPTVATITAQSPSGIDSTLTPVTVTYTTVTVKGTSRNAVTVTSWWVVPASDFGTWHFRWTLTGGMQAVWEDSLTTEPSAVV